VGIAVDEALEFALATVGVVAGDPARNLVAARHDARLAAVLVLEPVCDDFELKLPDRAEQKHRAGDRAKDLDRAFLAQLPGSLPKVAEIPPDFGSYRDVGLTLYRTYVVPFEVSSYVLLAAIIGAVVLAKRRLV